MTSAVASAVLMAATAHAAGLGKLTVLSALGQPLRAEIELTAVTPEEASGLVAKLAPQDAYRGANIDFNPALLSLHFDVEQRNGRQVVKVTSSQSINEPFVALLLELNWTGGRMVREYTFLLDPPEVRAAQAPQVTAPVEVGSRPASAQPSAAAAPARPKVDASEYTVKRGDNLTRIANQVKPANVSLDTMLVALYRANPEAFSGKNMNRLKSGEILSVPNAEQITAVGGEGEARSVVVAHAIDFNAYRAKLAGQVAASTATKETEPAQKASGKVTAKVEEKPSAANTAQDKLTLSKATTDKPQAGKTAAVAEDKIARQKQAEEASARVKELEKNVNDLEKLMVMKHKTAAEAKPSAASASASASAAASSPAAAPEAQQPKKMTLPPKRIAEPSLFDTLADNLTYIGLAAAALLAGALGIVSSRRRKQLGESKEEPSVPADAAIPAPQPMIAEPAGQNADTDNSVFTSTFAPSASQLDTNEVDPVAEADVYIAYGRDAQAEEILKEALRVHPERHPVRLKLLEIYVARNDARSFETQASELYALTRGQGDEWEHAATMGRTLEPGNPLYSAAPSDSFAAAAPAAVAAAAAAPDFGSDYADTIAAQPESVPALTPLDLELRQEVAPAAEFDPADLETALPQTADAPAAPTTAAADDDQLMDFDMDGLNLAPTPTEAPAPADDMRMDFGQAAPAASTDALDLDLAGFDIPEVPAFTEPPQAPAEPLDFDTSVDQADTATPAPASQEFDLSGIDLDLPNMADGAAPTPASGGGEPLSALHMEMDTKLDLAVAYQEIGDKEGARELLDEVLRGGSDEQVAKANAMKVQLG
ncbi:FimV/HubP family polar landmark protein [Duganella lactea]|uniref:FimV/HubP family polar landmark protein n=1 Tax=Duganella lactea TaxID=2692173 RepID=UPI00353105B4